MRAGISHSGDRRLAGEAVDLVLENFLAEGQHVLACIDDFFRGQMDPPLENLPPQRTRSHAACS